MRAIVAISNNHVIGNQNFLPWYIPEDLKYFKKITMGHILLMGRKTFESLPTYGLKGRICVVLTSRPIIYTTHINLPTNNQNQVHFVSTNEIGLCLENLRHTYPIKKFFVIGGHSIFDFFKEYIEFFLVTHIHKDVVGDVFYEIDKSKYAVAEFLDEFYCPSENCMITRIMYKTFGGMHQNNFLPDSPRTISFSAGQAL